jgi:hypothetical protein
MCADLSRALRRLYVPLLAAMLVGGCAHHQRNIAPPPPNFSYYNAPDFRWDAVARVVILPIVNETAHPQAGDEMQRILNASIQQMGMFEIVSIPPPVAERLARQVRETGRFNEVEVIELARCTGAHAVIAGTLSHFSPYYRPRVGLTLHAISPDLGRVVGSVDGLWDANCHTVAQRARLYFAPQKTFAEKVYDKVVGTVDDAYAEDLVLESPRLFSQFVCGEACRLLVGDAGFLEGLRLNGEEVIVSCQPSPVRSLPPPGPAPGPAPGPKGPG